MAVVTEYLFQLIAKQVEDQGLVVWYDPEQAYGAAAAELALPKTTVARYDGSFFSLRHEIDHLLNDGQPPGWSSTCRLSADRDPQRPDRTWRLPGSSCSPGQQPPTCNTRLSVVARNALKPILGDDQVAEIERQVEAGKLSLADLNALADKGKDISTGVLTLIFGSANPQEVALAFLHGDQHDAEIEKKSAQKELRNLLQVSFDIELPAVDTLAELRERLARHVLLTDLIAGLEQARAIRRCRRSRWRPRRAASMPACDWPEPGGTAGTCGTATWPRPTRSSRSSPSASLTSTRRTAQGERDLPVPSSGRCCGMSKANCSKRPTPTLLQLADVPAVPLLGRGRCRRSRLAGR